ncbi:hypothetical protein ACN42_g11677, partial [Penicillium freii]
QNKPHSTLNGNGDHDRSPKRQRTITPSHEPTLPTDQKINPPAPSRPRVPAAALSQTKATPQFNSLSIAGEKPGPKRSAHPPPKEESSAEEGEVPEKQQHVVPVAHPPQHDPAPAADVDHRSKLDSQNEEREEGEADDDNAGSEEGEI